MSGPAPSDAGRPAARVGTTGGRAGGATVRPWLALLILAAIPPVPGAAERAAAANWDVAVGLGGAYRAGSWTPVRIAPAAGMSVGAGDRVVVWAEDPDGLLVGSPPAVMQPTHDGGLAARALVRVGRPAGRLLVRRVAAAGGPAVASPAGAEEHLFAPPIPSHHEVLTVFGELPAVGRAARLMRAADAAPITVVAPAADQLVAAGAAAIDYELADVIIVCGRSLPALPAAVVAGIDAWVRAGGRLVFCAGGSAIDVGRAGGPAADWLPGPIERLVPLRRVAALEAYARGSGLATRPGAAALRVPLVENRRALAGSVEAFEGANPTELPLVVRSAHGFGTVTWVGVDLDDDPFVGWSGTDTLVVRLLGGRSQEAEQPPRSRDGAATDLAAQLRRALERSGGPGGAPLTSVPFEIIIGLGLLYVLALYPVDWWIASRGRPWLAWFTLPAWVALFSLVAWGIGERRRPAVPQLARTAEVLDLDSATLQLRSHGWAALWSRDNATFDVSADRDGADTAVSWFADAGPVFGGIDAALPHPPLAAADAHYGDSLARLDGVAVAAAANRLFEVVGRGPAPVDGPVVRSSLLRDAQGILRGSIAHELPFELENCRLAHGGWLYDVGTLPPGRAFDVQSGRGPRSLAGALQRRAAVEGRDAPTQWDPQESDPLRILELAGFHAAAGGTGYTLLPSGRLRRLDLSPLLTVDRAVLVGTVADATAWSTLWTFERLQPGGSADTLSGASVARLCRIVIPLERAGVER